MEEEFRTVLGESSKEVVEREIGEEAVRARARKTEALPRPERGGGAQLGPRSVQELVPALCERKGGITWARDEGAERGRGADKGAGLHAHAQRAGKEEEKGMPIIVAKDNKSNMIMARVVPSKGVDSYAVETVRRLSDSGIRRSSRRATASRRFWC